MAVRRAITPRSRDSARPTLVRVLSAGLLATGAAAAMCVPVARAEAPAVLGAADPRPGATATLAGVDCTVEQAEAGAVSLVLYAVGGTHESEDALGISLVFVGPDEDGLPTFTFVIPALPAGAYLGGYSCDPDATAWRLASAGDGPLEILDAPWASSHCSLGACGSATLEPSRASVGARVRLTADWAYFASAENPSFFADIYLRLHEAGGDIFPGSGTEARLTLLDDRRATFRVPELAAGRYTVLFAGSGGDEAFGQPIVRQPFVVTRRRPPDTDASAASGLLDGPSGAVVLAVGVAALVMALRRGRGADRASASPPSAWRRRRVVRG